MNQQVGETFWMVGSREVGAGQYGRDRSCFVCPDRLQLVLSLGVCDKASQGAADVLRPAAGGPLPATSDRRS